MKQGQQTTQTNYKLAYFMLDLYVNLGTLRIHIPEKKWTVG